MAYETQSQKTVEERLAELEKRMKDAEDEIEELRSKLISF